MELNEFVLKIIKQFPTDGSCPYQWHGAVYHGVTEDLRYKKFTFKANEDGSKSCYCCGLTFEAWFKAMKEANPDFEKFMTELEILDLFRFWMVREFNGDGPGPALKKYGLGKRIENIEEIKAGDFIQFWRTSESGHSVIFIDWVWKSGKRIGFRYWSAQDWTKGVGYADEYFSHSGGYVDEKLFYATRAFVEKRP